MSTKASSSLRPGRVAALAGREPRLRRGVLDQRVDDPDAEPAARDPERREPRQQAAASAGTIWSGSVVVSSWATEAARIPTRRQQAGDERVGERQLVRRQAARGVRRRRSRTPPGWPARTASSGRAPRAPTAMPITMPLRMKRSIGTAEPSSRTALAAAICGRGWGWLCRRRAASNACSVSGTASEETSFASGEAVRSGLKTRAVDQRPPTSDKHEERAARRGRLGQSGAELTGLSAQNA